MGSAHSHVRPPAVSGTMSGGSTTTTVLRYPFHKPIKVFMVNGGRKQRSIGGSIGSGGPRRLVLPRWPSRLELGAHSYVNEAMEVHCFRQQRTLEVGKYCSLGACTFLVDGDHHPHFASTFPFQELGLSPDAPPNAQVKGEPIVGNDVWIADGAVLLGGVHVGDGAVVAGHAVVTRSVPPYAVVAGNPARVVKYRFDEDTVRRFMAVRWWDLPDALVSEQLAPLLADVPTFLATAERARREVGGCPSDGEQCEWADDE